MVRIDGTWQKTPERRGVCPSYTATGTAGEAIALNRMRPKSHRNAIWTLTVTPVDGKPMSVNLGRHATFDHAEGALLNWSTS